MDEQVIQELGRVRTLCGSLRESAIYMGLPGSYAAVLSDILNGKEQRISLKRRNEVLHCLNHFPENCDRIEKIPTKILSDLIRWRQLV